MFNNITALITDKLINSNTIKSEDRDIYEFGIRHIFITILNITTVITIGLLTQSLKISICFILSFIPLRIFAGGFHFRTPLRCYIFSSCFVAAVLLAMRCFKVPLLIYCFLYCVASVIILLFAPVEDYNKPLDKTENRVYKKRTIIIWIFESAAIAVLFFAKVYFAIKGIMVSTIILSVMIVLGMANNVLLKTR